MNKESILKNLNEIKELVNDDKKFKYKNIVNFNCEYIKKELEAIKNTDVIDNYTSLKNDNANFNEVLECLECLNCEPEDYRSNDRAKDYVTIKQALLNAEKEHNSVNLLMQELDCKDFAELRKYARCGYEKLNKKYLNWEDLEFEDFPKEIEVRIGYNICKLEYRVSMLGNKTVILMCNNKIYLQLFENGKQFFNDLHLEVLEEL